MAITLRDWEMEQMFGKPKKKKRKVKRMKKGKQNWISISLIVNLDMKIQMMMKRLNNLCLEVKLLQMRN